MYHQLYAYPQNILTDVLRKMAKFRCHYFIIYSLVYTESDVSNEEKNTCVSNVMAKIIALAGMSYYSHSAECNV